MATDILQRIFAEHLQPFSEVVKDIHQQQPGSKLHIATVHRWALRGCKGIKLESVRIGGRLYTSKQAVNRFLRALNGV